MPAPALVMQTTYAELVERCAAVAFDQEFRDDGSFVVKKVKDRRYWYFQSTTDTGRSQKYVGPETPELLERIEQHRRTRGDEKERRSLVSTLARSFNLPRPIPQVGEIVSALAKAGVFRLRGVLVGTVAYQTYPAMLGIKLPGATLQTSDIDIAQFSNISVAVEDTTPPMLEVLQSVDKTFRAVPHASGARHSTSYAARGGMRVDFLTPNRGPDTDKPKRLPALGTDAQPLRFLDFLIHDPEVAVLLHGDGIYTNVPAPERYALHKLMISNRRRVGTAKKDKDLSQAGALLEVLAERRSSELKLAWAEALSRGPAWRKLLMEGIGKLPEAQLELVSKAFDLPQG
jgi:hypothetical protein